ncbi:MAG: nucleotidyl transferase AbiEii/AbiGii toxin family protein, partial [bacterium]|nr:nucleotidyl transferase AbiEii/AbiGii toxin family protein [bacterium]
MIKNPKILSGDQVKFLDLFVKEKSFSDNFYLTGGTTLTEFYIPYRYSEDLDFFSENEVNILEIAVFLKSIQKKLNYKTFDIKTSFNRNIVILSFADYDLKLEFTYFPFPRVDETNVIDGLKIDSIKDIAINKLFTIYQNPRSRDFMDLYMV